MWSLHSYIPSCGWSLHFSYGAAEGVTEGCTLQVLLLTLLIPISDLQKKSKKFKWTQEAEIAFIQIKELLISPPVLRAPTPEGLFQLESDTSCEGVKGTLFQKQGDEWVVIGYHSKRLPASAKNFGVTELELTGFLVNIHGFMQLLNNCYFKVLVDHKAIEYMIKSKTETPTVRLKTLLLKLSEYTIDLKYQKGSEIHTSDALSRLHDLTDTPDSKEIIPLNFLQHLTPNYIEHSYLHWTDKTKDYDMTQVKRNTVDHLSKRLNPILVRCQLQTQALHDPN